MKLGQATDASGTTTVVGKAAARSLVTTLNTLSPEATSSAANGPSSTGRNFCNSDHESGGRRGSVEEILLGKKSKSKANISGAKETLTGSIEFLSVQKSNTITRELSSADFAQPSSYKLIDLGTAVGVHEDEDIQKAESVMTMTEMAFAG